MDKQYVSIDLKSFYASVECRERGLDPLNTNLVVADESRTEKTICLAVSPALKEYGLPGRARLFEVVQAIEKINAKRAARAPGHKLEGNSAQADELAADPTLALDCIVAPPRMGLYMEYSTRIYKIYTKYVSPEDIHVYSVDEVFMDITAYLRTCRLTAHEFVARIVKDVLDSTGITATAGIGTNMYLAKVAMDIVAKHVEPDENGVRIAELNEKSYRRSLWSHTPLTDFWRVGEGYAQKLDRAGLHTMGDIARCSLCDEALLYKLFGVNAELLIDHAWGYEPVTIADVKAYKPQTNSVSNGQVLSRPYSFEKGKLVVREMAEVLVLDLVEKGLKMDQIVLTVGYDVENAISTNSSESAAQAHMDHWGRKVPKHAHGTVNLRGYTDSTAEIADAVSRLYDSIVSKDMLVRRMYVVANHVQSDIGVTSPQYEQADIFTYQAVHSGICTAKETDMQNILLSIHDRYGKNALIKGSDMKEGATTVERNGQIGGHRK